MAITYFGSTTITSSTGLAGNTLLGDVYVAPVSGGITTARGYLQNTGPVTASALVAVYAQSGGNPGAFVCKSDQLSITVASGLILRTFTFSTPGAVVSGSSYYLMFYADIAAGWTFNRQTVGTQVFNNSVTYPTCPNPFGTPSTTTVRRPYLEAGIDDTWVAAGGFVPRIAIVG